MAATEDSWHVWLSEAHAIVQQWESTHIARMLSTVEAVALAEAVARGLDDAFHRGQGGDAPPSA